MKVLVYNQIVDDLKRFILREAKANGWLWFYNLHQKEVLRCAEKVLRIYKADRKIVLLACWLHDVSKYLIEDEKDLNKFQKTHHLDSYNFSKKFLENYDINKEEIDKIANCVLRHRNKAPYEARVIEEKIVAVADTLSHLTGVFYFTHFKFHPGDSIEEMVKKHLNKLASDRNDLSLLPKAGEIVKNEYRLIKRLHDNYFSNRTCASHILGLY